MTPHAPRSWIIPARAGFTRSTAAPGRAGRDHPRSRGVYPGALLHWDGAPGSSPLARGLRGHHPVNLNHRRIIPARAGFTSKPTGTASSPADHPRSRGVYPGRPGAEAAARGSSPLARGLLGLRLGQADDLRIIPARAGFTHARVIAHVWGEDHPRSRGVYRAPVVPAQ